MNVNGLPEIIKEVEKNKFIEKEYLPQIQFAQYLDGCDAISFGKLLDAAGLREPKSKKPTLLAFEGGFTQTRYYYKENESGEYYQWHFQKTYDVLKFLGVPLLEPRQVIGKRMVGNITFTITNQTSKYFHHSDYAKANHKDVDEQEKSIATMLEQVKVGIMLAVEKWMFFEEFNLNTVNKIIEDSKKYFDKNKMEPMGLNLFLDHEQVRAIKVLEMIDNLEAGK
jgi:hypothetical protein